MSIIWSWPWSTRQDSRSVKSHPMLPFLAIYWSIKIIIILYVWLIQYAAYCMRHNMSHWVTVRVPWPQWCNASDVLVLWCSTDLDNCIRLCQVNISIFHPRKIWKTKIILEFLAELNLCPFTSIPAITFTIILNLIIVGSVKLRWGVPLGQFKQVVMLSRLSKYNISHPWFIIIEGLLPLLIRILQK